MVVREHTVLKATRGQMYTFSRTCAFGAKKLRTPLANHVSLPLLRKYELFK